MVAPIKVSVANGAMITCESLCKGFTWKLQGHEFKTDVLLLALDNYDMVLGIQWLSTLGDIILNFNSSEVKFQLGELNCVLKGDSNDKL